MSDIKKAFKSRFPDGWIMEADYKQLEIFALAFLSGDINLKTALRNKVDLHRKHAAMLWNIDERAVTSVQRRQAKEMSFQLQYGAGYKSMAEKLKISEELTRKFIYDYYIAYPGVGRYHEILMREINKNRTPTDKHTKSGYPIGRSWYESPTNRRYCFLEQESPDWMRKRGVETSFKPTEWKNYIVQGFATGEIMPMMRGKLRLRLVNDNMLSDKALLINTVHDNVVLDVQHDYIEAACALVKETLELAPEYLKEIFDIDFDLPLEVDIKYGKTWGELEYVY